MGFLNLLKGGFTPGEDTGAEEEDVNLNLSFCKIPLTLALRRRKFEEEQQKKYGFAKEKIVIFANIPIFER